MTQLVTASTDGSAHNNPNGPAGWAWFVAEDCWAAGGFNQASNQVAELFAVLALLRAVPKEHELLIRTDSQFVINSLTKWMPNWSRNGWRKSDGSPVANLPLMQDLQRALQGRKVRFEWVKGHSGDPMNEIADKLCSAASDAVRRGRTVVKGPGWTGFTANPVIPGVRKSEPRKKQLPTPQRELKPQQRLTQADLDREGYGANARIKRVAAPVKPHGQVKMDLCGSCDGPINPLTLHCRCGSL